MAFFRDPSGIRIDVMLADTVFDEAAINRADEIMLVTGEAIRVCLAEDLVIYKMLSTRIIDRADVESIILKQGDILDDGYIEDSQQTAF